MDAARMVVAALAVLACAAGGGCGGAQDRPSAERSARVETLRAGGERAVLALPAEPNGAAVVVVHGYDGDARLPLDFERFLPITERLLRHGYAVAAGDAHGNAWGDERSVAAYRALAAELADRGLAPRYVIAVSMGGLAGMRLLAELPVRAWVGIYPVCDLRSIHRRGAYADSIEAAHAGDLRRALRRLSPAVPRAGLDGVRMRFYASPDDTVVPKAANADRCAAVARRRGARARVVTARGDHGHPSHFRPREVVALFERVRTR